jgi:hypothetical protein
MRTTYFTKTRFVSAAAAVLGLISLHFLLFAFSFPSQIPAQMLSQARVMYSQNQWQFLLILHSIFLLGIMTLFPWYLVSHHQNSGEEKSPLLQQTLSELKRSVAALTRLLQTLPSDPRNGALAPRPLPQQLQSHLQRLRQVNLYLQESTSESVASKPPHPASSLVFAQLLQVQQQLSACLFASKSDYHQLSHVKEELLAFKGLFAEVQRTLSEELRLLHGTAKAQQELARELVAYEREVQLCRTIAGEVFHQLSLGSDNSWQKNREAWQDEALPVLEEGLARSGYVDIVATELARNPSEEALAQGIVPEAGPSREHLAKKSKLLVCKLRFLGQSGDGLQRECAALAHGITQSEAYQRLYASKLRYLADAVNAFGLRLQGNADGLQQRIGDLTQISAGVLRVEKGYRESQDVFQQCVVSNQHFRRSLVEQKVAGAHCERAVREMVEDLAAKA